MKALALVPILALGGIGLALAAHAHHPAIAGLAPGAWFRIVLRSSLDRRVFGDDAAGMQAQTLLGRQGFDVRASEPDAADPFVYHVTGIYRGESGALFDVAGLVLIAATEADPVVSPPAIAHIDARPVDLASGVRYFGRASLSWPISMLVTPAKVRSKLTEEGFTDVQVFDGPKELPADWPPSERGGDLFVSALYSGAPRAMPLPGQVLSVWQVT